MNEGTIPTRGQGKYESDEAKENARLRKELRDTQDALEILKKAIGILGNKQKLSILKHQRKIKRCGRRMDDSFMLAVC